MNVLTYLRTMLLARVYSFTQSIDTSEVVCNEPIVVAESLTKKNTHVTPNNEKAQVAHEVTASRATFISHSLLIILGALVAPLVATVLTVAVAWFIPIARNALPIILILNGLLFVFLYLMFVYGVRGISSSFYDNHALRNILPIRKNTTNEHIWLSVITGLVLVYLLTFIAIACVVAFGVDIPLRSQYYMGSHPSMVYKIATIVALLIVALVSAYMEEWLYRGFLFPMIIGSLSPHMDKEPPQTHKPTVYARMYPWIANAIVTLVFVYVHAISLNSWQSTIPLVMLSLVCTSLRYRTGKVAPAIALHGLYNLVVWFATAYMIMMM